MGNLTKVIEAVGTTIQQEQNLFYDAPDGSWGLPTRVQNEVGAVSSMDYHDERGWPLSASSPQNLVVGPTHPDRPASVTATAYNADGLPSQITDPLGHSVSVSYVAQAPGSRNLVVTYTHGDSSTRQVLLDPAGRVLEAKDENGGLTRYTYTGDGAVKTIKRAAGTASERTTTYYYDSRGDMIAFDPPKGSGSRVNFSYMYHSQAGVQGSSYEGQVTKIQYADGRTEYAGYNSAGEPAWERQGDGTIESLTRDSQHRVTTVSYPAHGAYAAFNVSQAYDEFGRVTSMTDGTGTKSYSYDSLNRLTAETPPAPRKAVTYSYTKDTTLQRWITGVSVAGVGSYTYRADSKGRLSEVLNPFNQLARQEYDLDGKNTLTVHANGVQETRSYTARDWLAGIEHRQANGVVMDTLNYYYTDAGGNYAATGHLQREVDAGGRTHAFSYNAHCELIQETHPDFGTRTYSVDAHGNRTSDSTNGVTDFYGVDAADKLTWVNQGTNAAPTSGQAAPYTLYGYDADGHIVTRERRSTTGGPTQVLDFAWDGDDRLQPVKQGTTTLLDADYDGEGLRTTKTDPWTGTHDYTRVEGEVVHDSNNNTVITPDLSQRSISENWFLHEDRTGSTRYITDSTGNNCPSALRYDAFGQRTATVGPAHPTEALYAGEHGYQTEYRDATEPGTGLQYLDQRYYEPETGRFISPDPIGFEGGDNLFVYADGNPTNMVDPTGESAVKIGYTTYEVIRSTLAASDQYVEEHADDYSVLGHLWANTRAAGGELWNQVGLGRVGRFVKGAQVTSGASRALQMVSRPRPGVGSRIQMNSRPGQARGGRVGERRSSSPGRAKGGK